MTSAPRRSRRIAATAVLPDAVGPKSARTDLRGSAGRLLEAMLDLGRRAGAFERAVLLGMHRAPIAEPRDAPRDALVERRLRLPVEELARLAHVGDVVRHLAEQRRGDRHLRRDAELRRDQV